MYAHSDNLVNLITSKTFKSHLWQHRWLFLAFTEREIKNRYIGSVGGLLWAFLHPLLLLAIYGLVFRLVFKVSIPELGDRPFVEFVALGLWPWLAFQESVQRGTQAIQANASLVKKVAFPHELLVYAATTATFAIHMAGFSLVLIVLAAVGNGFSSSGVLPGLLSLLLLFILANALALAFAALQVFLRDLDQFLPSVFMVFFYATPILYPVTMLPDSLREVMLWNPLVYFVSPLRDALIFGQSGLGGSGLLAWGTVPLVFLLGRWLFLRLSPHFEDFV